MAGTILYFLEDPSMDKHFHDYVLTGLEKTGYNPIVTYFFMDGMQSKMAKQGHQVIDLGCTRETYKGFHPGLVARICKAIKKYNVKAIHSQRHHPLIYMAAASYLTDLPTFFYTIRSTKLIRNLNRRFSFSISSRQITRVIAVSQGVKTDFVNRSGLAPEKITVIPNGLDPSGFELDIDQKEARQQLGLPLEGFLFGMAARFKKAKDHRGLIEAFSIIRKKGVSAGLALAGDGPLEDEIKGLAESHHLDNEVFFLGKLAPEKISLFLSALDVFVHPSWREGMPASVLEAMASGLPVIATDAEGITDIFDTPKNFGRILTRGDIPLLARTMEDFYHLQYEERLQMGRLAQARVLEAFTHKHMVDKTVALYDRFIN